MKKTIAIIISLIMLLSICACGNDSISPTNPQNAIVGGESEHVLNEAETLAGIWIDVDLDYIDAHSKPDMDCIILTTDGYFYYHNIYTLDSSYHFFNINDMLNTFGRCPTAQNIVDYYHRVVDNDITCIEDLISEEELNRYEICKSKDGVIQVQFFDEGDIDDIATISNDTTMTFDYCEYVKYNPDAGSIGYFVGNWEANYFDSCPDRDTFDSSEYMVSLNDNLTYITTSDTNIAANNTWSYKDGVFELSPKYVGGELLASTRSATGETFILSDNMFMVYSQITFNTGMTHYYLWTFERAA